MHALNERPLTLRASQICEPKDLLLKILVVNCAQSTSPLATYPKAPKVKAARVASRKSVRKANKAKLPEYFASPRPVYPAGAGVSRFALAQNAGTG
jgi:hypothetical protein